jgi:hypothetical protein
MTGLIRLWGVRVAVLLLEHPTKVNISQFVRDFSSEPLPGLALWPGCFAQSI